MSPPLIADLVDSHVTSAKQLASKNRYDARISQLLAEQQLLSMPQHRNRARAERGIGRGAAYVDRVMSSVGRLFNPISLNRR